MRHVLPNGLTIEGTIEQVNKVRASFGYSPLFTPDGIHYNSSTKGVVRIADMDEQHVKNAIRKLFSSGIANLDTRQDTAVFLNAVQTVLRDVTLLGLLQSLQLRVARKGR